MKTIYSEYLLAVSVLLFLAWTISCSGKPGEKAENKVVDGPALNEEAAIRLIKLVTPEENAECRLNQPVNVVVELQSDNRLPDSVQYFFDNKVIETVRTAPWNHTISGKELRATGRKPLKVIAYKDGKAQNPVTRFLVVYSDVVPAIRRYRVVKEYPHDRHAFTQGLFYDGGSLFESTGQETESSLREVEISSGRVLRQMNLDPSLFGEGITLCKGRIFQVTWRNKVGFVYEKETFRQVNRIYYPTEGWGLTTIEDKIVMSDGTNILYYYEPEMFTSVSRIEVYDNEKKIDSLNELEYISGEIWANIWMEDRIAIIDPVSGKVKAYIDMTGLFPQGVRNQEAEVLNGIAWDRESGRIFVTGKRWSKLFEIKITE